MDTDRLEQLKMVLNEEFQKKAAEIEKRIDRIPEGIKKELEGLRVYIDARIDALREVPSVTLDWLLERDGKWAISEPILVDLVSEQSTTGISLTHDGKYIIKGQDKGWLANAIEFDKKDNGKWRVILLAVPIKEEEKKKGHKALKREKEG